MKLLITFALSCQWVLSFEFASLVVSVADPIINKNTVYTISYDRTTNDNFQTTAYATSPITSTDTVTVTFPPSYSLSTVTCQVSVNNAA